MSDSNDSTFPAGYRNSARDLPSRDPSAPEALRQRGILSCTSNADDGQRIDCAGAIWRWYGKALTERYTRPGAK